MYGREGGCRYGHSEADEEILALERRVVEAKQQVIWLFFRMRRCRYGAQCRWRHAEKAGDSDYNASDGEADGGGMERGIVC